MNFFNLFHHKQRLDNAKKEVKEMADNAVLAAKSSVQKNKRLRLSLSQSGECGVKNIIAGLNGHE
jgi:hypothetical protein